jgi:transcriptional regulator with XRE-family HTH domain
MSDERSATALDRKLGTRLRARRIEIGMSQEHLADQLGITFQQVQKYEKGVNRMAASRLFDVAKAVDLPVAQFFEGAGPGARREDVPDIRATSEGAELAALFAEIKSKAVRRRVIDLVRALIDS